MARIMLGLIITVVWVLLLYIVAPHLIECFPQQSTIVYFGIGFVGNLITTSLIVNVK